MDLLTLLLIFFCAIGLTVVLMVFFVAISVFMELIDPRN